MDKEIQNITKSYKLINARYKLSSIEIKMITIVLSKIKKEDNELKIYDIPIKEFEFITKNNNHKILKDGCKSLMTKPLEIEINENEFILFNWFSKIHYKGKESIIQCRIDQDLKPFLLELKKDFKTYDIEYILKMNSEYSIRIYELLKQYERIGKRTFILEDLYKILDIPKSYYNYKDFRVRVIQQAGIEIAKLTDIYFEYEPIKEGRKVTKIEFKIFENKQNKKENKIDQIKWVQEMRKNHKNKELVFYKKENANIRINEKGMLYLDNGKRIEKEKALIFWEWAYKNQNLLKVNK